MYSTVHLLIGKSIIFVSSLIKNLRPELESIATNFMPEVASHSPHEFKIEFWSSSLV